MDRTLAIRLIGLYNRLYARIFMAAMQRERDEVLRGDISVFFSGSTGLAELFRGLTLERDGTLPLKPTLRNLTAIQRPWKIEFLAQGLSEFLDFMLFTAMETMNHLDARGFEKDVQAILAEAAREGGEAGEGRVAGLPVGRPPSSAPIDVVDLEDPVTALAPPDLSEMFGDPDPEERFEPLSTVEPMPPGRRTSVAIIPYLPDDEAYELASGLRTCRAEATFARERAEQIALSARSDDLRELREAALRCAEHAASAIRALDQLDQLVTRLRRH